MKITITIDGSPYTRNLLSQLYETRRTVEKLIRGIRLLQQQKAKRS